MTVPAPTSICGTDFAIAAIAAAAASVRKVISMTGMPPSRSAFAKGTALFASLILITGIMPNCPMVEKDIRLLLFSMDALLIEGIT
jgi:hypothetical protein